MNRRTAMFVVTAAAAATVTAGRARGQSLTLDYGPTPYNGVSGYRSPSVPTLPGMTAGNGVGVGKASVYANSTFTGVTYAYQIQSSGSVIQLQPAGTSSTGQSSSTPYAVNASGITVGSSTTYNGAGNGPAPVMWNASGGVTVLANLGTDVNGNSYGYDYAINQYGVSAGQQTAFNASGGQTGIYAVRWDATGTVIAALNPLGTSSTGSSNAQANAINSAGTAVGTGTDFTGVGSNNLGSRAVLWAGGGTTITVLGTLGTTTGTAAGSTSGTAYAVNDNGVSVGTEAVYNSAGTRLGTAPTRWDASGNVTQLGTLGVSSSSNQFTGQANAINYSGTAVGSSIEYNAAGGSIGNRATVWAAGGSAVAELPNLGLSSTGSTTSNAYSINDDGLIVGTALSFNSSGGSTPHATLWVSNQQGGYAAVDLNTLLNTSDGDASNFVLNTAYSISSTDWVTALATYEPTNTQEEVLFNVSFEDPLATPEPTSMVLLATAVSVPLLGRRRRRSRSAVLAVGLVPGDPS